jgi:putative transposase
MARPLRIEYPNAVYHVTSRGNARSDIYFDDTDRENFLSVMGKVIKRYNWLCHAYCLMDNHYHILIETPDGNLSQGMRQLNGIYTQNFNRRHFRGGHVFQGRFKAVIVDKESHLLELCRYVVLNPVRAGIVTSPNHWHWSSYRSTVGTTKKESYLTTEWILAQFGLMQAEAQQNYRRFVAEGIVEAKKPWEKLKGQIIFGSDAFIGRVREFFSSKEKVQEIPRLQRFAGRPALETLFPANEIRTKTERNHAIIQAHVGYGYTLKEIATYLHLHYTTISKVIHTVEP